ncbi:hypothetical protein [Lactococcus lactis]
MTETAKERLMRGLEEVIDFETKVMKINEINPAVNKTIQIAVSAITESNRLPDSSVSTNKLSVEKLQERCDRYKKVLTEIRANIEEHNQIYDLSTDTALLLEGIDGIAFDALAAIGGDDD